MDIERKNHHSSELPPLEQLPDETLLEIIKPDDKSKSHATWIYLIRTGIETEGKFQKRKEAALILAQRGNQEAGKILLRWLQNPQEGVWSYNVGGYTESYGGGDYPYQREYFGFYVANDADPKEVQALAAEALGIMGYRDAKETLSEIVEKTKGADSLSLNLNKKASEALGQLEISAAVQKAQVEAVTT